MRKKEINKEQQTLILASISQLRSYAHSLSKHRDAADDLVQDCLHRAIEKIHMWQPGSNMRAWLFTIMHNLNADKQRRESKAPIFVSSEERALQGIEPGYEDEPEPELSSTLKALDIALSQLRPEHREVIHLVCMEELKYAEVADILGLPVGTIMSRLSRAREHLRSIMYDESHPNLRRVK